jgi:hypothetical protein
MSMQNTSSRPQVAVDPPVLLDFLEVVVRWRKQRCAASCPSLDLSGFADARLNLRVLGNPVYVLIPHKIVTVGRIAPGVPTLDRREGSKQFQFAAVEARAVARSQVGRIEPSNIA